MKIKFWSHKNGFRSPTEQQLVRWETDGGNYRDCQDAVIFEGRLYCNAADLRRAQLESKIKKVVNFVRDRMDPRQGHQYAQQ